jgi:GT2 family glycosyltransferase
VEAALSEDMGHAPQSSASSRAAVVVPNWNGAEHIVACLESLANQTAKPYIIVVDNGSIDESVNIIHTRFPDIELITLPKNYGFTGGVNVGIRRALEYGHEFVALFNNDAVADKNWAAELVLAMAEARVGIATSKLTTYDGRRLDSTGEYYTSWGLPFSRGRGEPTTNAYDKDLDIFAASGGATIYRSSMLKEIGLFDNDFFAYYEDVDISFRAQLKGWKIRYAPNAVATHKIGGTSGKIRGFTTFQTMKNLPFVVWKDLPAYCLWRVLPRFLLSYGLFFASAVRRGQGGAALRGLVMTCLLFPKKLGQRFVIQRQREVTGAYMWQLLFHDLPPNAHKLRALRRNWRRVWGMRP